ncbi:unnamed protein product [Calypogeia fissa]
MVKDTGQAQQDDIAELVALMGSLNDRNVEADEIRRLVDTVVRLRDRIEARGHKANVASSSASSSGNVDNIGDPVAHHEIEPSTSEPASPQRHDEKKSPLPTDQGVGERNEQQDRENTAPSPTNPEEARGIAARRIRHRVLRWMGLFSMLALIAGMVVLVLRSFAVF